MGQCSADLKTRTMLYEHRLFLCVQACKVVGQPKLPCQWGLSGLRDEGFVVCGLSMN